MFKVLIFILALQQSANAQTTLSIPVSADAHITKSAPTTNRGSKTYLAIDYINRRDILLKFTVTGIGSSVVKSAKLRLVAAGSGGTNGGEVRKAAHNNWTETGVTYNNAPAADSVVLARQGATAKNQAVELDLTAAIKSDGTYSFRITSPADDKNSYDYYSREEGSSVRPTLKIVIATPTPTPTPTPTATPTPSPSPSPSPSPNPTPDLAGSCLDQSGPLVTVSGAKTSAYFQFGFEASTKVDLWAASWTSQINIPIKIGGGDKICASGGRIQGTWDPYTTSWSTYHDTYAFTVYGNNMTVEGLRVDNYGDAINIRNDSNTGHNFVVKDIHVTNNHDDCFQNDSMKAGTIVNNLFDGCYVFYSSRGYGSGPNNTVTISNNLVRLQGYPTYYGGQASNPYDPSQYRHGGFWKIDEFDKAPKLAIHNNIFMLSQDSRSWIPLMPDPRSIGSCSNNIVVWLGSGPFPEPLHPCFKLTTDRAVWDNAVREWKADHGY